MSPTSPRPKRFSLKTALVYLIFYIPPFSLLFIFTIWPLIYTVYLSFHKWNMISPNIKWVGIANYSEVIMMDEFWISIKNTLEYTIIFIILNLFLPYLLSFILNYKINRFKGFYRALLFLPTVISLSVSSVIFLWFYNPLTGPFNAVLDFFHLPSPQWLSSYSFVIIALGLITAWKSFGYNFIVLLAGMTAVPQELIEAAKIEKASNWQIFWYIIRPLTSSTALYVLVMTFIIGSQYVFVPIQMLTNGGPEQSSSNIIFLNYQYAFNFFQTGKAAAIAILTIFFFALLLIIQKVFIEKKVYYEN